MGKIYVRVTSDCDAEGHVLPLALFWEDGTRYDIDRVLDVRNAASLKAGGYGERYTVRLSNEEHGVCGKVRHLFYERGLSPSRWFVEGKD